MHIAHTQHKMKWNESTNYINKMIAMHIVALKSYAVVYQMCICEVFLLAFNMIIWYHLYASRKLNGFCQIFWTNIDKIYIGNIWYFVDRFVSLVSQVCRRGIWRKIQNEREKIAGLSNHKQAYTAERNIRLINFTRNKCMRSNLKQKRANDQDSYKSETTWTMCMYKYIECHWTQWIMEIDCKTEAKSSSLKHEHNNSTIAMREMKKSCDPQRSSTKVQKI